VAKLKEELIRALERVAAGKMWMTIKDGKCHFVFPESNQLNHQTLVTESDDDDGQGTYSWLGK
jgi:hypothetical protein